MILGWHWRARERLSEDFLASSSILWPYLPRESLWWTHMSIDWSEWPIYWWGISWCGTQSLLPSASRWLESQLRTTLVGLLHCWSGTVEGRASVSSWSRSQAWFRSQFDWRVAWGRSCRWAWMHGLWGCLSSWRWSTGLVGCSSSGSSWRRGPACPWAGQPGTHWCPLGQPWPSSSVGKSLIGTGLDSPASCCTGWGWGMSSREPRSWRRALSPRHRKAYDILCS